MPGLFDKFAYVPNTAMSNEMVGIDEQFPEFHNRVRFDADTKKGSVLDVIHVMTGSKSGHASQALARLEETHPELCQRFEKTRLNGKVSLIYPPSS